MNKLTRNEAIDKLIENDLDCIITGHQDNDNSYLYDLLCSGFKGYLKFSNDSLSKELYERYDIKYSIK